MCAAAALWAAEEAVAPLGKYTPVERRYWAFQPRKDVAPPAISRSLDPHADRRVHPRRAPEKGPEARARGRPRDADPPRDFRSDRPAAHARRDRRLRATTAPRTPTRKLVDRLLASPHYGEQWGRHWLDVVRFAESDGFEYDTHRPDAWRYRDYVIRASTTTSRTTQFVSEQLAGDEMDRQEPDVPGRERLQPPRAAAQERRQPGRGQFAATKCSPR